MRGFIRGLVAVSLHASLSSASPMLEPPGDAKLIGRFPAHGVQIYACATKNGVRGWTLKAPDAELSGADGKLFARHSAGPTWTALDGSSVTGKLINEQPAPRPASVDWLLLRATSKGKGVLAGTRFVQRLATVGGEPPTSPCISGREIRVPYSADYVFYR